MESKKEKVTILTREELDRVLIGEMVEYVTDASKDYLTSKELDKILEDANKKILLNIMLRDGGFEINDFDTTKKTRNYVRHLKSIVVSKYNKNHTGNKSINIILGSKLTYKYVREAIDLKENGFSEYIDKIVTHVEGSILEDNILIDKTELVI